MQNSHWACVTEHLGVGIKRGDHNVKWNCAVGAGHNPAGGTRLCATCKAAYKGRPNARQYAPTFHYDCTLAPWEHEPPNRRGALGGHRAGCPTKSGHEGGPGPKCYGCHLMYLGRKDNDPFLGRYQEHPHYACSLTPAEHAVVRGQGRGHRPGCNVAEGHDSGQAKTCSKCKETRDAAGKMWGNKLLAQFGLTRDQYGEMLASQGGGCAICGKPNPNGKRLAVDHNHTTNEVRGLLCHRCNVAIGHLLDDEALIRRAADYVGGRA